MPNQIHPDRKRFSFAADEKDYETLNAAAKRMGFTLSVLLREATIRTAEEIRKNRKIQLLQLPKDDDEDSAPIKRYVFIANKEDWSTLQRYAKRAGLNVSMLIREGMFRLAEEARKQRVRLTVMPKDNEGIRRD
jgi:predicted DNA-binding ribbon-helix-helix protein